MWLSVVTYDLAGFRTLSPEMIHLIFQSIGAKRTELAAIDGGGGGVEGFRAPGNLSDIAPTVNTFVIKRAWNTESAAQEFANFADAASEYITSTIEDQV